MTLPVANFLVENVFCILDDHTDDSRRIGAHEFGLWVRDLPALMAPSQPKKHTHPHGPSVSTVSVSTSHSLTLAPASRQPSVRPFLSCSTFMNAVLDNDRHGGSMLPTLDPGA